MITASNLHSTDMAGILTRARPWFNRTGPGARAQAGEAYRPFCL
jgi:hypothetical protein